MDTTLSKKKYQTPVLNSWDANPHEDMLIVISGNPEDGGGTHPGTGNEEELVKESSFDFDWE